MPISIEADPTLAQGYIKVNGTTAATVTSTGLTTASLQNAAVTNAKLSLAANDGEIKKALNADNAPPIYACRAWVNFDGTAGSTVDGEFCCTIRGSGNVSKVVRTSSGTYTMTFATAMPDANYAALTNAEAGGSTGQRSAQTISQLAGSFEFQTRLQGASSGENMLFNRVAIFR
jgi:hypothetical protein